MSDLSSFLCFPDQLPDREAIANRIDERRRKTYTKSESINCPSFWEKTYNVSANK